MMKRAIDLLRRVSGLGPTKELVGFDRLGNKYYRYNDDGTERREVQWHKPYMMYDPNEVPSEWRMWLRKLRDQPPEAEEMARSEQASALLQRRVAALEHTEGLRRARMQAMGKQATEAGNPDLRRLMGQVAGQPPQGSAGDLRDGAPDQVAWTPPGQSAKGDPSN